MGVNDKLKRINYAGKKRKYYAKNCGALEIRVEKLEDLIPAMKKLNDDNGDALLEVITNVNLI